MTTTHSIADEQTKLWNGSSGKAWVDLQEVLDQALKPFEELLVDAIALGSAGQVLDVGCGTGATTLAVARRQSEGGSCTGIDISEPMIRAACARAEREGSSATFIRDSAETHAFAPKSFDAILSRFGVMFFEDSARAFSNLRRAAKDGAELRFVAWRSPLENPFMTTAERAAAPLLPELPPRRPGGPGQFAFADQARVSAILAASGWSESEFKPIDVVCSFPEAGLMRYVTRLGPLGLILHEADEETRTRVLEALRAAFAPFVYGAEVRFDAACWKVVARAR